MIDDLERQEIQNYRNRYRTIFDVYPKYEVMLLDKKTTSMLARVAILVCNPLSRMAKEFLYQEMELNC